MARRSGGCFIVLEGIDGAGTTSHTKLLAGALAELGHPVLSTCEPSDGDVGRLIRTCLKQPLEEVWWEKMALLFAADRIDHLKTEVEPSLEAGTHVISDRYDYSSVAYQSTTAPEGASGVMEWIAQLNAHARRPDLTIVLEVSAETAARRRLSRGQSEVYERTELQLEIAEAYRKLPRIYPEDTFRIVRGDRPREEVHQEVLNHALTLLQLPR